MTARVWDRVMEVPLRHTLAVWIHHSWVRLHEPRVISAVYGAWWTIVVLLGGHSIFHPPRTIEATAGDVLMPIISGLLTAGALIGVVSAVRGAYWLERSAVTFVSLGIGGYLSMVAYLWATTDGNRGLQLMGLIGALGLTLMRLQWVLDKPYSREQARARADPEEGE